MRHYAGSARPWRAMANVEAIGKTCNVRTGAKLATTKRGHPNCRCWNVPQVPRHIRGFFGRAGRMTARSAPAYRAQHQHGASLLFSCVRRAVPCVLASDCTGRERLQAWPARPSLVGTLGSLLLRRAHQIYILSLCINHQFVFHGVCCVHVNKS